MEIIKDFIKVASANILLLIGNIANGFFIPMMLTVSGYASFRTYTMYLGILGFFHLGYNDGINIKYGGLNIKQIDKSVLISEFIMLLIQQLSIVALFVFYYLHNPDQILLTLLLVVLFVNTQFFVTSVLQALGEFKTYSIVVIFPGFLNICLLIFLFITGNTTLTNLLIIGVIVQFAGALFSTLYFYLRYNFHKMKIKIYYDLQHFKEIMKKGFFIMLGNILFILFFDVARYSLKIEGKEKLFALYSLSLTIIGIFLLFISSVNKVFYPYFSKDHNKEKIKFTIESIYALSSFIITLIPFLKFFISNYLIKYTEAIPIINIFIFAIPAIFALKSVHINLYKVFKQQQQYLLHSFMFLLFAITVIFLSNYFTTSSLLYAYVSVLVVYLWEVYASFKLGWSKRELLKKIIFICCFLSIYFITRIEVSFTILLFLTTMLTFISYSNVFLALRKNVIKMIKNV